MKSGRYTGVSAAIELALRIDEGGPTNMVSGDLIQSQSVGGGRFVLSFVFAADELPTITGVPADASTDYASLDFDLKEQSDELARVDLVLKRTDGAPDEPVSFGIAWQGAEFRQLKVRPFVAAGAASPESGGLPPVQPAAGGASTAPIDVAGFFARSGVEIVFEQAQALAGSGVSSGRFWSKSELAAAAANLSQTNQVATPDAWKVPFLVATRYELPNVLGIMFEPDEGNAIARLAAVFYDEIRNHSKVKGDADLIAREYLFTTVHELGHVLGLPHAWDALGEPPAPDRDASALTFMNYPDTYRLGYSRFYRAFQYDFRPEELTFLWHGPWTDVWPGSRDTGGADTLMRRVHPSLALELRSPQGRLATLGEPVQLEVKLENRSASKVRVPTDALQLEGGRLRAFVARQGESPGLGQRFRPLARMEIRDGSKYLGSVDHDRGAPQGIYNVIDLTYGCDGFVFKEPGHYRVTVAAEITPDFQAQSAPLLLEVRSPPPSVAKLARELHQPALGRALVLGIDPGSELRERLEGIAEQTDLPAAATVAAMRVGEALARPFKYPQRKTASEGDPRQAAHWLGRAVEYSSKAAILANPVHTKLLEFRARCLTIAGQEDRGREAFSSVLDFVDGAIATNDRLRRVVRRDIKRARRTFLSGGG